ncbi:MAG: PhoX family phosphatase [Betaproteobacteria bacterium]|nr:PhoX family phosphatase [Betaproteobacteria bacterium]
MAKDLTSLEDSNRSANATIHQVSDPSRRRVLMASAVTGLFSQLAGGCATLSGAGAAMGARGRPGFAPIAPGTGDRLVVPEGYVAQVIAPWGEPVGVAGRMPAFRLDAGNSAEDQSVQMGMHHDGLHFFPFGDRSDRGVLAMNHEYTDDGLLHPDGTASWSAEKVRKSQAAHGLSVIEVARVADGSWNVVRPSRHARRVTMSTPHALGGPAAGHRLMRTAADPEGRQVLGTLNNCAAGMTPWGSYLSGEENFAGYFDAGREIPEHHRRWGLREKSGYRWAEFDERFNAQKHPNEPNRFGWIVELDPMDPTAMPIKRTALGRAAHEGAWVAVTRDQRAVVYSGEDARFEYLYRFVSRDPIRPARPGQTAAQANRDLLDHGTLYVARFDADGTGRWIALVHGSGPLTASQGFADQAEVLIKARQASDAVGGTRMDRPEWIAIDPIERWVCCTLTNNSARGTPGQPAADAANPRERNVMGQIIRWREAGDFDGERFEWEHLVLAGDPANEREDARGNIRGDLFACPDGIAFGPMGILWVQTDVSATQMHRGEFARIGSNQMLAFDAHDGRFLRFLTGPVNCEVTGAAFTPDGRTLFVNIQHPGESPGERSDPRAPRRFSNWPDFLPDGRPRSATVVITRRDGGVIGT